MRRILGLGIAAGALLMVSAVGIVRAAAATAETQVSDGGPKEETLLPRQMLEKARGVLESAERSTQSATQSLRAARKEGDVVKALCLDDKLAQLEVARATVEERVQSLAGSVEANDSEAVNHDFSVVSALGDRIAVLGGEANQCIGEDKTAQGSGSSLQVIFDPAIPTEDTSSLPIGPNISTPPVAASATF